MNQTILLSALAAHGRDGVADGFIAAMDRLAATFPVRTAAWLRATGEPRLTWPDGAGALDLTAGPGGIEPFPVGLPGGGSRIVLPALGVEQREQVAIEMEAPDDDFDLEAWSQLRGALDRLARRESRRQRVATEQRLLRMRIDEAEALQVLGVIINATLDLGDVLEGVGRFVRTFFGAHASAIYLVEGGKVAERYGVGERPDDLHRFADRVLQSRRPLVESGDNPGGLLGVPLLRADEVLGALVLVYRGGTPPDDGQTRLAAAVATHAAVAVANANLHRQLDQRGQELAQLNVLLREQSEIKERFFASVNHELRTPLTAILGYQELIMDGVAGPIPDQAYDFLRRTRIATGDLLGLVNDILDMSRIHAGRMELEVREVNVLEIAMAACSTVETIAIAKGIALPSPRVDPTHYVHADPTRLRQILLNLLSNAVKFTTVGSVEMSSEVRDDAVLIHVHDTGPGIPLEARTRIFEEFEQVRGPKNRAGTGLGLAISRRLARMMEGDVTVTATGDAGSIFTLRLPHATTS